MTKLPKAPSKAIHTSQDQDNPGPAMPEPAGASFLTSGKEGGRLTEGFQFGKNPPSADRAREALDELFQGDWASLPPLLQAPDIPHFQGCACGSCSFKEEEDTLADTGTVSGTTSTTSAPALLGDMADFLLTGYWNTGYGDGSRSHNVTASGTDANNGVLHYNLAGYSADADGISADRAFLVREAFKLFEATLGIQFVETTSTDTNLVDFFFRDNDSGAYASHSYYNSGAWGSTIHYAQINVAASWSGGTSTYDDYTLQTIFHEIGHAIGLGHQGPYNGSASYGTDNVFENDSWQASMMSYFSQTENTSINASYEFLQTPMAVDWMALDEIYGRQGYGVSNAFAGDTIYGFNTNITSEVSDIWANFASFANRTASTIVDGSGNDTLDLSGYGNNSVINLAPSDPGSTAPSISSIGGRVGNLTIAQGTIIENAIGGAGSEVFYGNAADNDLTGNGGDDTFYDSTGADTYRGGDGTDEVLFGGAFSSYGFEIVGSFLQVIDVAIDLVESSVEWLIFSDQSKSFGEIVDGLTPNGAPIAANDAFSVGEDQILTAVNVLGNDSDPDGDAISVTAVAGGAAGTAVTLASGAVVTITAAGDMTYDQNGAFDTLNVGETATDSFTYQMSDGRAFDTATVTVTIDGAFDNSAPTANDDLFVTGEAEALSGDVLANDLDGDGDPLTVTSVNGQSGAIGSQILLSSGALLTMRADGTFDYDPNGAFDGLETGQTADDSFTYAVSDGAGGSASANVTVTIEGFAPPVVEEPLLIDFEGLPTGTYTGEGGLVFDGVSVTTGSALSGQYARSSGFTVDTIGDDFDFDAISVLSAGGRVRVEIAAYDDGALVGSSVVNARTNKQSNSTFDTSFDSIDQLVFSANGDFFLDDLTFVTRTPTVPGAPTAVDDEASTVESQTVSFNLLANDTDPDGDPLTLVSVANDSDGTVLLESGALVTFTANGDLLYDPNGQFDGLFEGETATDIFQYQITDGNGAFATATAEVIVQGEGAPPPAPTSLLLDFEPGSDMGDILFVGSDPVSGRDAINGQQSIGSAGNQLSFSRADGSDFDLESATFLANSGKRVELEVQGFDDGVLVADAVFRIRDNRPTEVIFDNSQFDMVDEITITSVGGFVMDDLQLFL